MRFYCITLAALLAAPAAAFADPPIGQVKTSHGTVTVTHEGASKPLAAGDHLYESDVVATGPDSTVGITFDDNSTMALGSGSEIALDMFRFDRLTHDGEFDSSLHRGTLAVRSGDIVRQRPESMRIRTPTMILGVRGTQFLVRADDGK